jgi:hypothetical protein
MAVSEAELQKMVAMIQMEQSVSCVLPTFGYLKSFTMKPNPTLFPDVQTIQHCDSGGL